MSTASRSVRQVFSYVEWVRPERPEPDPLSTQLRLLYRNVADLKPGLSTSTRSPTEYSLQGDGRCRGAEIDAVGG